jgi:cell wall-associated NlpC family hydrolase
MTGEALAQAAEALLGTRFRLHGRDPRTGLDCLGLLAAALAAIGRPAALPNGYTLRSRGFARAEEAARACGFAPVSGHSTAGPAAAGPTTAGDVLLVRPHPCQFHLLVATGRNRFIHAHAGLRRVIAIDALPAWPIVRHWRLQPQG